jgi:hypothetical protein
MRGRKVAMCAAALVFFAIGFSITYAEPRPRAGG